MKLKPLPIILFFVITVRLYAQTDFKVIGYLPYYRFDLLDRIAFERLTHLNIAFANPRMSGELDVGGKEIRPVVQRAKEFGLTVCISLAGGYLLPEWEAAWEHLMKPENRSAFIHRILEYVDEYSLDGVDVDLEWRYVNEKYSPFVLELGDSLRAHEKLMTVALPGTYRYPQVSNAALAAYDWINVMAYDLTGPWNPNRPGPHSPYSFAVDAVSYWQHQGLPPERLALGVPFYGYDFSTNPVRAFTYSSMVEQNPDFAFRDQVGQAYYNGIPTIQAKSRLAKQETGGIMIWELGQDDFGDHSLLRAIYEVVNDTSPVGEIDSEPVLLAYPSPFSDYLEVENRRRETLRLQLMDVTGRSVRKIEIPAGSSSRIQTDDLAHGLYVLTAWMGDRVESIKVVK